MPGVHLDAAFPPTDCADGNSELDTLAELIGHAQRDELRPADDAVREALLRGEQLVRPARAGDDPEALQERELVRRLREKAVGEV